MTIRLLSISNTVRWHNSARRRPVAYSIISMVRCIRLLAASISRATSCWSSMVGRRRCRLGNGMWSGRYGRRSVLTKRKRSAAVRPSMVPAESLRSRNRYAWYWRMCSGPSRSGERHVWRWPRDGVFLGRRLRRMVCLPRLLLRLRTRRGSGVLCRLWTRSVVHLRRWLRCWTIVCRRVRTRGLVHARGRSGLPRAVIRSRHVVVVRSRHVLRSARLLVVLGRSRCLSCVVRVRGRRRPVYGRKTRPRCFPSTQSSWPWRRDHGGTSLVPTHELGRVFSGCLLVLDLRRGRSHVLPPPRGKLCLRGLRLDAPRAAVVGDAACVEVIGYGLVVNVAHIRDVDVVDGAVVVEVTALPVSAVIAVTGVTPTVVNTAVEND